MTTTGSSRRGFFKHMAMAAGALGVSRMPGLGLFGGRGGREDGVAHADATTEAPAVFIFNMKGGYNALFSSADSFKNKAFGVTANNIKQVAGSNLFVDKDSLGSLDPMTVLPHMASIGVFHNLTSHPSAQPAMVTDSTGSRLVKLSRALGGTAAIRCAVMGTDTLPGDHPAIGDVSVQQIRDLSTTISVLGGVATANAPDRAPTATGIAAAAAMSATRLGANPVSGRSLVEGYPAATGLLEQATVALDYAGLAASYGVTASMGSTSIPTNVNSTTMQIMGAELMIRAGANVVIANNHGWDTHGDIDGDVVRNKIEDDGTIDALRVFTANTIAATGRNVITVIMGDFARSLPGSNHQPNLTATVIGKYVKPGSTGVCNADVGLPASTPGIDGLWSFIAAAAKATTNPWGANPHGHIL